MTPGGKVSGSSKVGSGAPCGCIVSLLCILETPARGSCYCSPAPHSDNLEKAKHSSADAQLHSVWHKHRMGTAWLKMNT